ncbi:CDP-glucose 4,6-dehydratase [Paenibacillus beijingensis]|uniref:CDP-glucose 4,6-dehydratase n=2 Tax=Paenibacillus beijingensis TaxID=1126833 RepID=A0A0D5NGW5_9BACL|nr:CDP-glucose 4,6-dehydratase [Paenibacillus beijingensis]AJY74192.1 CDP-glucose 4,6-dehydratase [Paenibacillus beijingensis]
MIDPSFWKGKSVFITGNTGFKGSWISMWLHSLGANVTGYSLQPHTNPSLFELCRLYQLVPTHYADIRDKKTLTEALRKADPDIVIHMAAQPIVRESYQHPLDTYEINVMGTVNLLEAVREMAASNGRIQVFLNVTSDKCYENNEWPWGYRENDRLGGHDPYSNSKACSELVTSAYRNSFFHSGSDLKVAVATARAGNVIGGGDWSKDRLVPDCINALHHNRSIVIRNPHALRPWQHVLEPVSGYILLAQQLYLHGSAYAQAWNFGPYEQDVKSVQWIVNSLCRKWGQSASFDIQPGDHPHEAQLLKLDCSKAIAELGWKPKWHLDTALDKVVEWARAYEEQRDLLTFTLSQIDEYIHTS